MIRRREFITLLGGAAAAWPVAARAQQTENQLVGVLHSGSATTFAPFMVAFRQGLKEAGVTQSHNVTIEYRWAENHYDRLPQMAADLVHRQPAAIYAGGSVRVAKAATSTIPIVFTTGEDPVKATRSRLAWSPASTGQVAMSLESPFFMLNSGRSCLKCCAS